MSIAELSARVERLESSQRFSDASLVELSGNGHAQKIIRAVCRHFNVPTQRLLGKCREWSVAWPRFVSFHLLRESGLGWSEIARLFGGRDHAGVIYGVRRVQEERQTCRKSAKDIKAVVYLVLGL